MTSERPIVRPLEWEGDAPSGSLVLLDQTRLPSEEVYIAERSVEGVVESIVTLRVRGAPAIGIAAAYGIVIAAQTLQSHEGPAAWIEALERSRHELAGSRPTAVNLFWALDRMLEAARAATSRQDVTLARLQEALLDEARRIHDEDRRMCHAIGRYGAPLLQSAEAVLTHCNAGSLATAEYGTALGMIYAAHDQGHDLLVYVDETRPLLQGARLTAWELMRGGVRVVLLCDSAAAHVMREGRVQAVVTGADRIAANGDVANKIGTCSLALAARQHEIPFYVAAPTSTFDRSIETGAEIPIEERAAEEITESFGRRTAPEGTPVYNPAFDVTPAGWITALVTELGVIRPVNRSSIDAVLSAASGDGSRPRSS